jgi:hypothetical protein
MLIGAAALTTIALLASAETFRQRFQTTPEPAAA